MIFLRRATIILAGSRDSGSLSHPSVIIWIISLVAGCRWSGSRISGLYLITIDLIISFVGWSFTRLFWIADYVYLAVIRHWYSRWLLLVNNNALLPVKNLNIDEVYRYFLGLTDPKLSKWLSFIFQFLFLSIKVSN